MPNSSSEGLKFDHSSVYNSRMNQSEFKAGEAWAMRTSGAQDSPVIRVEAVNFIKRGATRRVRVRHLDGDLQGFEELVTTLRLISTWKDWPKVQRDNANLERLRDHVNANNPPDQVTCEAASAVLASSSEDLYVDERNGYTTFHEVGALERVAARANVNRRFWLEHPSVKTRDGWCHVSNRDLINLAVAFAQTEPHSVHLFLDLRRDEYLASGFNPGYRYHHTLLLDYQPRWVIARAWAGGEAGHDVYKTEIDRLRNLVHEAIRRLDAAECGKEARKLERALMGK
jgi:hypothetical protein